VCNACGEKVSAKEMKAHMEMCPEAFVDCPANKLKNHWSGHRKDLQQHQKECQIFNLLPLFEDLYQKIETLQARVVTLENSKAVEERRESRIN
jgi:hypothetical protein